MTRKFPAKTPPAGVFNAPRGRALAAAVFVCLFWFSCGKESGGTEIPPEKETAVSGGAENRPAPAMSVQDALRLPEGGPARRMILEKGNFWTTGLPGFGDNALPALSGVYRTTSQGGTEHGFTVWLCRETLYYSGWDTRTGPGDFQILEKRPGDSLLAAAAFNETWTGIFSFPGSPPELSQNDIDRIISIYRSRFLYFLALAQDISDISLPAQADF
ncbi:MAG: hypothetical protein LBI67_09510 [Treponema sp.]|jgi:hypothetical protein|nr:hypothetical protein [Treponema sp.]